MIPQYNWARIRLKILMNMRDEHVPLFSTDFNQFTGNPAVMGSSPCFDQKLFRAFAKADKTEGSPLSLFSALCDFFSEFFLLQRVPFDIFDLLQQTRVSKSPKGFPLYIFRHYETDTIFYSIQNFNVISRVKRFFRLFDDISIPLNLTILRFTKDEGEVRKEALAFVSVRDIRTSEAFSGHERHPCGALKRRLLYPQHIQKSLRVLSLRCTADFRRSRFVDVISEVNSVSLRSSRFKKQRSYVPPLVETASTFYMLQACMQGNFFKNLENSVCIRWYIL